MSEPITAEEAALHLSLAALIAMQRYEKEARAVLDSETAEGLLKDAQAMLEASRSLQCPSPSHVRNIEVGERLLESLEEHVRGLRYNGF